jgi:hypothetical protein
MNTKSKQLKAKKKKGPPEPTLEEYTMLYEEGFYLPGWQFETTLQTHCIQISRIWIGIDDTGEQNKVETAILYGLKGVYSETNQSMCATMFLRYGDWLYQTGSLDSINTMVNLIDKIFQYEVWQKKQEKKIHKEVTSI